MLEKSPVKSLGLAGDGDELHVVELLQEGFGIEFSAEALGRCETVGDLHALLLSQVRPANSQGRCASAMAFYRLRRALAGNSPDAKHAPATRLADLAGASPYALRRDLGARLNLVLPVPKRDWAGRAGWLLIGFSLAGSLAGLLLGLPPFLSLFLIPGVLLTLSDQGDFGAMTLGDWARATADLNVIALLREGADRREPSIWRAAVRLMCIPTGVAADRVRPETRLIG
jgi:hypothetical protein